MNFGASTNPPIVLRGTELGKLLSVYSLCAIECNPVHDFCSSVCVGGGGGGRAEGYRSVGSYPNFPAHLVVQSFCFT